MFKMFFIAIAFAHAHGISTRHAKSELAPDRDAVSTKATSTPFTVPLFLAMGQGHPGQMTMMGAMGMKVGTPAVEANVVVDLGSSVFWLDNIALPAGQGYNTLQGTTPPPLYDGAKSSTAHYLGKNVSFAYGTGSMDGPLYNDLVAIETLGKASVLSLSLDVVSAGKAAYFMRPPPNATMTNGIIGLDAGSLVQEKLFHDLNMPAVAAYTMDKRMPLTFNADGTSVPTSNTVQVGMLSFGGIDKGTYTGGIACVPILPTSKMINSSSTAVNRKNDPYPNQVSNNSLWWQFAVDAIKLDGDVVESSKTGPVQAFFDSGAPFAPTPALSAAYTKYLNDTWGPSTLTMSPYSEYPCDYFEKLPCATGSCSLPTTDFDINGFTVTLGPNELFYPVPGKPGSCFPLGLHQILSVNPGLNGMMIFGEIFWTKYAAILDWRGSKQAGFALRSDYTYEPATPLPSSCAL
jgi:hypothetical protein